MSSHDDPEARIRELERSLSDRTAELTQSSAETGSAPYGGYVHANVNANVNAAPAPPTAPLPPFGYGFPPTSGAPFPPAPTALGNRAAKRLVIGFMTLITVGVVAGAVVFVSNVFSTVSSFVDLPSGNPTVSGGGGPFGEPPGGSGVNRPQITIAEPTVSIAPPGSDISVSGVAENKTISCNDGNASISGVQNTVVLTGHCVSVTVSGIENVVTVDEADTIIASGLSNRVTYRTASPEIQNSGGSNVVEQG